MSRTVLLGLKSGQLTEPIRFENFIIVMNIIIIIITSYSLQSVGNIRRTGPTAFGNMSHAHGVLRIALRTTLVRCQRTNAAAHS